MIALSTAPGLHTIERSGHGTDGEFAGTRICLKEQQYSMKEQIEKKGARESEVIGTVNSQIEKQKKQMQHMETHQSR